MNAPMPTTDYFRNRSDTNSLEIQLVDRESDSEDSQQALLQILSDLQSYYRRRNFSHEERFGSPDPFSEAVLYDLANAYNKARQCIDAGLGASLRLESSITLTPSPR